MLRRLAEGVAFPENPYQRVPSSRPPVGAGWSELRMSLSQQKSMSPTRVLAIFWNCSSSPVTIASSPAILAEGVAFPENPYQRVPSSRPPVGAGWSEVELRVDLQPWQASSTTPCPLDRLKIWDQKRYVPPAGADGAEPTGRARVVLDLPGRQCLQRTLLCYHPNCCLLSRLG